MKINTQNMNKINTFQNLLKPFKKSRIHSIFTLKNHTKIYQVKSAYYKQKKFKILLILVNDQV